MRDAGPVIGFIDRLLHWGDTPSEEANETGTKTLCSDGIGLGTIGDAEGCANGPARLVMVETEGTMRHGDHVGFSPKDCEIVDGSFQATHTKTKTTGADRNIVFHCVTVIINA